MDKYWEIHFSDTLQMNGIFTALKKDLEIGPVDTMYFGIPSLEPIDFGYQLQWYHNQANNIDVNSPEAWDFDTTASEALLAILDSGIDTNHVELKRNVWVNSPEMATAIWNPSTQRWDGNGQDEDLNGYVDDLAGWNSYYRNNSVQPSYYDYPPCYGSQAEDEVRLRVLAHGTAVSGVAISQTSSHPWLSYDEDIVGVFWKTKAINVQITNVLGNVTASSAAAGIQYAALTGAKVISLSWTFPNPQGLPAAVDFALAKGALVFAAFPNENGAQLYPWSDPDVIAVSRISPSGYSLHHPVVTLGNNGLVAPGEDILSTYWEMTIPYPCTDYGQTIGAFHMYVTGTSLATPIVASIATMVTSTRKQLAGTLLSTSELRSVLVQTANSQIHAQDPGGFDPYWGNGLVNFEKAIYAVSRGDANNSGGISISDAVYIVSYVFGGGAAPQPRVGVGDCNCDGYVNISDAEYIVACIFGGGPQPQICFQYNY